MLQLIHRLVFGLFVVLEPELVYVLELEKTTVHRIHYYKTSFIITGCCTCSISLWSVGISKLPVLISKIRFVFWCSPSSYGCIWKVGIEKYFKQIQQLRILVSVDQLC